jgi:hypothetical protein
MAATNFSDYLGLNHYKKAKKLAIWPQSLSTLANMATSGGHFSRPSGMGSFWS